MNAPTYDGRQVMTEVVQQPRFGAESFGGNNWKQVEGITSDVVQIDTKRREELSIARVRDASNQFRQQYEQHALDVMQKTPVSDADKAAEQLAQDRQQMLEDFANNLPDSDRELFHEHAGQYATEYALQANQWVSKSIDQYQKQTEAADLDKTLQDVVASGDETKRLHARGLIAKEWGDKDPAVVDNILKTKETQAAKAYITNLSVNDPILARDSLIRLKGSIDENEFGVMFSQVNQAVNKYEAENAAANIVRSTTSTKEAISMAQAIKDPAVREGTLNALPEKLEQAKTQRLALDGQQFKGWVDKLTQDPNAPIDPSLSDSDKAALEGYRHDLLSNRNKQSTENDKMILGNLLLLKATNGKALSEVDLASLQPYMSTEGFAKAVTEITQARQGGKPLNPEEQTMFDELKSQGKGEFVDKTGAFVEDASGDKSQLITQWNANGRQMVAYLRDRLYSLPQNQRTPEAIKSMVADALKPTMAFVNGQATVLKVYQVPTYNNQSDIEENVFKAKPFGVFNDYDLPKGTKYKEGYFYVPKAGTYKKLNAQTYQYEKDASGKEVKLDRKQLPSFM